MIRNYQKPKRGYKQGAGVMPHKLSVHATLQDQFSSQNIQHIQQHNHLELQLPGIQHPLKASVGIGQMYTHKPTSRNTCMYNFLKPLFKGEYKQGYKSNLVPGKSANERKKKINKIDESQ